jgi:hypothetical protein
MLAFALVALPVVAMAQTLPPTATPGVPTKQQDMLVTLPQKDNTFTIVNKPAPQSNVTTFSVPVPSLNPPKQ